MKRAALLLAALSFLGISCERHSWEETKGLHKHGGGEKHAAGDAHAADHANDKPAGEEHKAADNH